MFGMGRGWEDHASYAHVRGGLGRGGEDHTTCLGWGGDGRTMQAMHMRGVGRGWEAWLVQCM